ncbi:MAG: tellurite resistance TerB family protein [Desulfobacterales bacterium]|nr:tellurite resistance TerB family protein [Desulfobacterales bacterium]
MFNPEKLLGGLMKNSMKGGAGKAKVGLGMGLLGVAMEAFEHFTEKSGPPKAPPGSGPPPAPPDAGRSPAPPGAPPVLSRPPSAPPSAPPAAPGLSPPSSPPPIPGPADKADAAPSSPGTDAVLLIRAMIGAANADGVIDEEERGRILDSLDQSGLSPEERAFMEQELQSPADLESIVREVKSPGMARRVYAASLMAITVDADAEKAYLDNLARRLNLDQAALDDIQEKLGRESP